jgi:hypothetical protein
MVSALLKILIGLNAELPYLLFFSIKNFAIASHCVLIFVDASSDIMKGVLNVVDSSLKGLKL